MRAATLAAPGEIKLATRSAPQPGKNEVRVRIEGCGVCGSNLPPWEGRPWFHYPFEPGAPGHEGWGVVDAVGGEVARVQAGDRVALISYHAFAEFDLAPVQAVVRLPPELDGKPFPGEALGCAMNVFRRSDIYPGQTVAILGIGFLGAVLTALCAHAGARVIAISRRAYALEIARRFGAVESIQLNDRNEIIARVKSLTSNLGCDCVIEATGAQLPLDLAGELARESGRLIIAGYHQDGPRQVNLQLWNWRGLDVINAHERDLAIRVGGVQAAVEAIAAGVFDPSPLYTHTFELGELGAALDAMKQRRNNFLKALVQVNGAKRR